MLCVKLCEKSSYVVYVCRSKLLLVTCSEQWYLIRTFCHYDCGHVCVLTETASKNPHVLQWNVLTQRPIDICRITIFCRATSTHNTKKKTLKKKRIANSRNIVQVIDKCRTDILLKCWPHQKANSRTQNLSYNSKILLHTKIKENNLQPDKICLLQL